MTWQEITINRQTLYEEIWKEPMTTVSKRYDLSDVGLRKICIKLDIPIPNRGYWTKLKNGKVVAKESLPKSELPDTYIHTLNIPVIDEEFEKRVSTARLSRSLLFPIKFEYENTADGTMRNKEVKQIQKISEKLKVVDGAVSLTRNTWVDINISPCSLQRTLILLDRFVSAIKQVGGSFNLDRIPSQTDSTYRRDKTIDRCYFELHREKYYIRVKERIRCEPITEDVSPGVFKQPKDSNSYRKPVLRTLNSNKYNYAPSGKLHLMVCYVGCNSGLNTTEDTSATRIEDKLDAFILRVEEFSLRRKIEVEIREEKRLERERQSQAWRVQKAQKDALLKKLKTFVFMARKLDRAESLRRFVRCARNHPKLNAELMKDLELAEFMADWLDPLVARSWPEVDDVSDHDPAYKYSW